MGHTLEISPGKMKSVCLLAVIVCVALASEEVGKSPRLFYVSTSASTTVISTAALCYISSDTAPLQCPGRKKRRVVVDGETGLMVQPSQSGVETLESEDDRALIENSPHMERGGRLLLYWITTTSISSTTSYTTTWSISAVTCTPPGQTSVDSYNGSFMLYCMQSY